MFSSSNRLCLINKHIFRNLKLVISDLNEGKIEAHTSAAYSLPLKNKAAKGQRI